MSVATLFDYPAFKPKQCPRFHSMKQLRGLGLLPPMLAPCVPPSIGNFSLYSGAQKGSLKFAPSLLK